MTSFNGLCWRRPRRCGSPSAAGCRAGLGLQARADAAAPLAQLAARAAPAARGALAGRAGGRCRPGCRCWPCSRTRAGSPDGWRALMGGLAAIVVGPLAAILGVSNSLGYLLPAIIGLESMGIPSPGETALVAAAVLASQGKLEIWLVILIGVVLGDRRGQHRLSAGAPLRPERVTAPGAVHAPPDPCDPIRRRVLRAPRSEGGVHRAVDRTRPVRHRLAGRDQPDAVQAVLLLERARRDHLGRHVRAASATTAAKRPPTCSPRPASPDSWACCLLAPVGDLCCSSSGASAGSTDRSDELLVYDLSASRSSAHELMQ